MFEDGESNFCKVGYIFLLFAWPAISSVKNSIYLVLQI